MWLSDDVMWLSDDVCCHLSYHRRAMWLSDDAMVQPIMLLGRFEALAIDAAGTEHHVGGWAALHTAQHQLILRLPV